MVNQKQNSKARKLLILFLSVVMVIGLSAALAPRALAEDGGNARITAKMEGYGGGSLVKMTTEMYVTIQSKADADITVTINKPSNVYKIEVYNPFGEKGTYKVDGNVVTLAKGAKPLEVMVSYDFVAGTMEDMNKMFSEMTATVEGIKDPVNLTEGNTIKADLSKLFYAMVPTTKEKLKEAVKGGLTNITVALKAGDLTEDYVAQLQKENIKLFNTDGKAVPATEFVAKKPQTPTAATTTAKTVTKKATKAPNTGDQTMTVATIMLVSLSALALILKRKNQATK